MDYFFQRCFRGTKSLFGVLGGLGCGTVIVLGFLGIQTIAIPIAGIIALGPVGFIFFENTKVVRDMEKYVSGFKVQNRQLELTNTDLKKTSTNLNNEVEGLHVENEDLKNTKTELVKGNEKLQELLNMAETRINKMEKLAKSYEETSKNLGKSLKDAEQNRDELKLQAEELINIRDNYHSENSHLKETVNQVEDQLKIVTDVNQAYKNQLGEMKNTSELLTQELEKTRVSYEEAKDTIKALLRASNVLEDLGDDMVKTEKKTKENVGKMERILNMFGREKAIELFQKYDKNQDDHMSLDEYLELVLSENHEDTE